MNADNPGEGKYRGWLEPCSYKKAMAAHSSNLAWRIPWTEETGRLQSMGLQRVGHDWAANTHTHTPRQGQKHPGWPVTSEAERKMWNRNFPGDFGGSTALPTSFFLLVFFFFLIWAIFKVFIEFVEILVLFLCFCFSFFWLRRMCDLSSLARNQACTHALRGEVITTGLEGSPLPMSWPPELRDRKCLLS